MGPIVQQLKTLGYDRATLIPTGYLSLLPLHSAWTPDPDRPTGKRYAIDDIHFTSTPSTPAASPKLERLPIALSLIPFWRSTIPAKISRTRNGKSIARSTVSAIGLFSDMTTLRSTL